MTEFTRRDALRAGGGLLAGSALPGHGARAAVPAADVEPPKWPAESGASLRVLRPAKFVDGDQTLFDKNSKAFTDKTGIPVRVDYVSWENVPPQIAVVANTGAGPDLVVGFGPDPHIYASKLIELTDVAEYLGKKYGGWFQLAETYGKRWKSNNWIGIPLGGTAGPAVYRVSWMKQAGFDAFPKDLDGFLTLCRGLKKIGHPCGLSLGHALGDANAYANFMLWAHGGQQIDPDGKAMLDTKETRAALDYARAMQETMVAGTMSWGDPSNNKAFAAGEIGLTQNGVSVYYAAKMSSDPAMQALAADTDHADMPIGLGKGVPETSTTMNAMIFSHSKYPNATKQYLAFMMEAPQYDPWLTASLGYWSEPLQAYAKSAVWDTDSKLNVFRTAMDTPFYQGYAGPVNDAAGTIYNDYVLVDMFARVVTGESTADASIRTAMRAVQRYYR